MLPQYSNKHNEVLLCLTDTSLYIYICFSLSNQNCISFSFRRVFYMFRQLHRSWHMEWCLYDGRWDRKTWLGFVWLRAGKNDRVTLWKSWRIFGIYKMQRIP